MKKILALILAMVMALALVACGAEANTPAADGDAASADTDKVYELRLASVSVPGNHQTTALEDAAAQIEELTGGHVKIKVYPNSALGDNSIVYGQVMTGDIDMCLGTIVSSYGTGFDVLSLPYLATDYSEYGKARLIPGLPTASCVMTAIWWPPIWLTANIPMACLQWKTA